jgi:HEAT repeat protein
MDLHDPSGTRRAEAIQAVLRSGDRSQVSTLIEMLDDPDGTVRLQAGAALHDLTGHDTGYRPYLSRAERRKHVEAWRAWWRGESGGGTP